MNLFINHLQFFVDDYALKHSQHKTYTERKKLWIVISIPRYDFDIVDKLGKHNLNSYHLRKKTVKRNERSN